MYSMTTQLKTYVILKYHRNCVFSALVLTNGHRFVHRLRVCAFRCITSTSNRCAMRNKEKEMNMWEFEDKVSRVSRFSCKSCLLPTFERRLRLLGFPCLSRKDMLEADGGLASQLSSSILLGPPCLSVASQALLFSATYIHIKAKSTAELFWRLTFSGGRAPRLMSWC